MFTLNQADMRTFIFPQPDGPAMIQRTLLGKRLLCRNILDADAFTDVHSSMFPTGISIACLSNNISLMNDSFAYKSAYLFQKNVNILPNLINVSRL